MISVTTVINVKCVNSVNSVNSVSGGRNVSNLNQVESLNCVNIVSSVQAVYSGSTSISDGIFSIEGALRRPLTYVHHSIHPITSVTKPLNALTGASVQ